MGVGLSPLFALNQLYKHALGDVCCTGVMSMTLFTRLTVGAAFEVPIKDTAVSAGAVSYV